MRCTISSIVGKESGAVVFVENSSPERARLAAGARREGYADGVALRSLGMKKWVWIDAYLLIFAVSSAP